MRNKDYTILVADDNLENLRIVSAILLAEGYKLALAANGEEVVSVLRENDINLILLDILMPGPMNGFDICRRLKKSDKTMDIPVIFVSALDNDDDIMEGFLMGGVDFIKKPVTRKELLARVMNQLRVKSESDELKEKIRKLEKSKDVS